MARTTTKKDAPGPFQILLGGGHRGARENQRALVALQERSETPFRFTYVDPEHGRATDTAALALRRGLQAEGVTGKIEQVIYETPAPVVAHLDRPESLVALLDALDRHAQPVLLYLLAALPNERLLAILGAAGADDAAARADMRALFATLGRITARSGSRRVVGEGAPVPYQLAEEALRQAFADHATENLSKIVTGRVPSSAPLEATWNGREILPLLVVVAEDFGDPLTVSTRALLQPRVPIGRGTEVIVAEVLPEAIRFHEVRVRATDGIVTVQGSTDFSQASFQAAEEASALAREIEARRSRAEIEREVLDRAAVFLVGTILGSQSAIDRVEHVSSTTATRTRPVYTTD